MDVQVWVADRSYARVQSAEGQVFVLSLSAPCRLFVVWTRSPRSLLSVVCERVPILERVSESPGFCARTFCQVRCLRLESSLARFSLCASAFSLVVFER